METLFFPILILLFTFIFYFYFLKGKSHGDAAKLPLGSTGWPVIGETFQFRSNPSKFVQNRVQKYSSKIFKTSLFGESFAILCGANGNKFLFSNENKLVQSWWPKSVYMVTPIFEKPNKEGMMSVRVLVNDCLRPKVLQNFVRIMDACAKKHLESHLGNKGEIVVVHPLAKKFAFIMACRFFLGIEDQTCMMELQDIFRVIAEGLFRLPLNLPGTRLNRAIKASRLIQKKFMSIIEQKKIELSKENGLGILEADFLSHLLSCNDKDRKWLNEIDIAAHIMVLILIGSGSSSLVITLVMMNLAQHPDVYNKVLKEQMEILKSKGEHELLNWENIRKMKYSWNVVCETMRMAPPINGTFREALTDFSYEGFFVPKGCKLYWSASCTHMNSEYFDEPKKFDPSRFDGTGPARFTFVPFGGGARACPGSEYAKILILVFIHNMVTKYRWERTAIDEEIIMNPGFIPSKGLPIRLFHHI